MIHPLLLRLAPSTAPPVPGQVTGLVATPLSSTTMGLSWSAPSSGGTPYDYIVEYKQSTSSTWATFNDGVSTSLSTTVIELAQGTSHDFRVSGKNSTGTGTASATATASTQASQTIKVATYGDSRSDLGYSVGPNMFDGSGRSLLQLTSAPAGVMALPLYMRDIALCVNGGRSGEETSGWNNPSRLAGCTNTAIKALAWDVMVIQYAINDVSNHVTSTATRDSTATSACTNMQALIVDMLSTGRKVVWQTTIQRTSTGYGTNAVNMRDCVDLINYGNGGSIQGMTAWIQARSEYGTQLFIHDVSALMNAGGVTTGAYADGQWLDSTQGTHPTYAGARRIAKDLATKLRTIYSDLGHLPMHRAYGPNFIPAVNSSYYGSETLTNCSKSAITYGTDGNGRPYGEVTITPNGTAGVYIFELLADAGTNGGRTSAGSTFITGDILQPRVLLTVDDGAGGAPVVNNVLHYMYCSYIGGSPAQQQSTYSSVGQGVQNHAEADTEAQYFCDTMSMSGDSSLIGAPSAGNGLRLHFQIYFPGSTTTPFRVRWTSPEIRKVA